jgi:hypothetical protein
MPNNRLETLVTLSVFGLPQFDSAICRSRDQDTQTIDLRVNQFANSALPFIKMLINKKVSGYLVSLG